MIISLPLLLEDSRENLDGYLGSRGVSLDAEGYTITSSDTERVSGVSLSTATAVREESYVEIKVISEAGPDFADEYLDDRRVEIRSLYTDTKAPYDAVPAREVECREKFLPEINRSERGEANYTYYRLYADQQRALGACSSENAFYRAEILTVYCGQKKMVLEVRHFWPLAQNDRNLIEDIRCG